MAVIAIISQKGGAGKTTLAVHLAAAAEAAGYPALVFDMDAQANASHWSAWRKAAPPEVIDCAAPSLLAGKIERAQSIGAQFIVIDTPPHSDAAASAAAAVADLVLIPCRPSGFDLKSVQLTASLIERTRKPAFVVFTQGKPNSPRLYQEAEAVLQGYGLSVAPVQLPDRAAHRHATTAGQTVQEIEPNGKAAQDVQGVYMFVCKHVGMTAINKKRKTAA